MTEIVVIPHNYVEHIKNKFPVDSEESERLSHILLDSIPGIIVNEIKDKIKEQIGLLLKIYTLQDFNISISGNTVSIHNFFVFNADTDDIKTIVKIVINSDHFICNLQLTDENENIASLYRSLFEKIVKVMCKLSQEPIDFDYNILYVSHNIIRNGRLDYTNYQKIYNYLKEKNIDIKLHTEPDRIILKIYDTKQKRYETFTLKLSYIINRIFSMLTNIIVLPRRKIAYILMPINSNAKLIYLVSFIYENKWECIIVNSDNNGIKQKDIEIFKSICDEAINKELGKIYDVITKIT